MGGFQDVKGWEDLKALTEDIANRHSLTGEEREALTTKMRGALARSTDQATFLTNVTSLLSTVTSGGLRALLAL